MGLVAQKAEAQPKHGGAEKTGAVCGKLLYPLQGLGRILPLFQQIAHPCHSGNIAVILCQRIKAHIHPAGKLFHCRAATWAGWRKEEPCPHVLSRVHDGPDAKLTACHRSKIYGKQ